MPIHLHELAAKYGQHPANMMIYLVDPQRGAALDDVWPMVKNEWVEALRWMDGGAGDRGHGGWQGDQADARFGADGESGGIAVSESAALVVEKLWRARRWGTIASSPEGLQKHTHLPPAEILDAVRELMALDVIVAGGPGGPYALNPGQRMLIEAIAQQSITERRPE